MGDECDLDARTRIAVLESEVRVHVMALKERMDLRFDSTDKAVTTAMIAAEKAVSAALVAQDKQNSAAFMSSEKAVTKAEEAQKDYNLRSNEFRGQLDDQAKMLMPRAECETRLKIIDSAIVQLQIFDSNLIGRMVMVGGFGAVIGSIVTALLVKWFAP